ncbi:Crp/Fnr family transcriptional regulator [Pelomonas sp. KK5]|uniref:Crp/Fnr family transcriptional regulator n=1 Tax=Pelomonas sp. KK5 TaxID=1855730 RepID=UPI00097C43A8|nr:Crp/Fnr family transcriptional regulator [Pelomonas sp. KK5]
MDDDALQFLRACPWLAGVPDEALAALRPADCFWRGYEPRESLYRRGETLGHVFGVRAGSFKIVSGNRAGSETITALVPAGEWFGEILLFSGEPAFADCVAIGRSRVLLLTEAALRGLAERWPAVNRQLLHIVARKARSTFWMNVHYKMAGPERMLARRLELSLAFGPPPGDAEWVALREHLSHEVLAGMLGLSRPRVSLAMQALAAEGLLEARRGRVRVHVARLRRYCDDGEAG